MSDKDLIPFKWKKLIKTLTTPRGKARDENNKSRSLTSQLSFRPLRRVTTSPSGAMMKYNS